MVVSKVLQLLKLPDGTVKVLVEDEKGVKILSMRKQKLFDLRSRNLRNQIFQKI